MKPKKDIAVICQACKELVATSCTKEVDCRLRYKIARHEHYVTIDKGKIIGPVCNTCLNRLKLHFYRTKYQFGYLRIEGQPYSKWKYDADHNYN